MDEFALIREVIANLGDRSQGPWVALGPGDDGAVIEQSAGHQAVASIDALVGGIHFPMQAKPWHIGYRALMVSLSDLAAMAATPRYVLVAVNLPAADSAWVADLAAGMAAAATQCDTYICGGNFAKGALSITVSVHGEVPIGQAVTRSGAIAGDKLYVSGVLGGAAACVREQAFDDSGALSDCQVRYFKPRARVDLADMLRRSAHAAIDVSDGLVADLDHLCEASCLQANLHAAQIPLCAGATLEDALMGGDDYEVLAAADSDLPGMTCIGELSAGAGILLDGKPIAPRGFNHFET